MTTLITFKPTYGQPIRRCDARCYTAKHPKCTCICAGINHGVGPNTAIDNTREHAEFIEHIRESGLFIINPATYHLFEGAKP